MLQKLLTVHIMPRQCSFENSCFLCCNYAKNYASTIRQGISKPQLGMNQSERPENGVFSELSNVHRWVVRFSATEILPKTFPQFRGSWAWERFSGNWFRSVLHTCYYRNKRKQSPAMAPMLIIFETGSWIFNFLWSLSEESRRVFNPGVPSVVPVICPFDFDGILNTPVKVYSLLDVKSNGLGEIIRGCLCKQHPFRWKINFSETLASKTLYPGWM